MDEESLVDVEDRPGRVIYIGLQGARIVHITGETIDYTDAAGEPWLIDLRECNKNWRRYCDQHPNEFITFPGVSQEQVDAENAMTVAMRGTRYVQFMDARRTRFKFASDPERWKLQGALFDAGWRTFDME